MNFCLVQYLGSVVRFSLIVLAFSMCNQASAQIATRTLAGSQPSEAFKPIKIMLVNGDSLEGFGFVNTISGRSFAFTETKPTGQKTSDWRSILDVKSATIHTPDTLSYLRFDNGKNNSEWYTRIVYEDENLIVGKMVASFFKATYCFRYKTDDYRWTLKKSAIGLENKSAFNRSVKRAFKKCPALMKNLNDGKYAHSFEGLIQLLKDGVELCE